MPRYAFCLAIWILCSASVPLLAQPGVGGDPFRKTAGAPARTGGRLLAKFARIADVTVDVKPAKAKWGETVEVKLTVTPKGEGFTYPAFPEDGTQSVSKHGRIAQTG